jgi:hypothetical protein
MFDAGADFSVSGDQPRHNVVDWFEVVGLCRGGPSRKGQDVVPGSRLGLGRLGQIELVAPRGEVM